jgi:hypothetical protein
MFSAKGKFKPLHFTSATVEWLTVHRILATPIDKRRLINLAGMQSLAKHREVQRTDIKYGRPWDPATRQETVVRSILLFAPGINIEV